jgi:hypothetical protein
MGGPVDPDARALYIGSCEVARDMLGRPEVSVRWEDGSVLPLLSVADLAGHLARAVHTVETYLDDPAPSGSVTDGLVSASAYFVGLDSDIDSPLNRGVRQRAREAAADGPDAVAAGFTDALSRVGERLSAEPADRLIRAFGDRVMLLDDYLVVRMVELTVHSDDLAVSLGIEAPRFPEPVLELVIETLVGTAVMRHGDWAVLRSLTRRERDTIAALRVI